MIGRIILEQFGYVLVAAPLVAFGYAWGAGYFHWDSFAWGGWLLVALHPVALGSVLVELGRERRRQLGRNPRHDC